MSDSPYARSLDDLVARTRVDRSEQVETQAEPTTAPGDWSPTLYSHGVGGGGDADGD